MNYKGIFVPYRGIYFLYRPCRMEPSSCGRFSSPIGESTFSTLSTNAYKRRKRKIFVPYRGIYFLYLRISKRTVVMLSIFVPYRGIYFLYNTVLHPARFFSVFSSPIGESTFSTLLWHRRSAVLFHFRPLSGNLLSLPCL